VDGDRRRHRHFTFEAPHTGSWKAWLDVTALRTDTILQQVIIPLTATQATLSFWLHIDTLETSTTKANTR